MGRLWRDVGDTLRTWRRTPGLTALVLAMLAVGAGANAAVYGLVEALLFRSAPGIADPATLVEIHTSGAASRLSLSSYPDFLSIEQQSKSFAAMTVAGEVAAGMRTVRGGDTLVRLRHVGGRFFEVLGVQAHLGRVLSRDDGLPGAVAVAVVAHDYWRRELRGSAGIVGRTLTIDGRVVEVVGVAAPGFTGLGLGRRVDVWLPLATGPDSVERGRRNLAILARLAPGVSTGDAGREVAAIADRLAAQFPETNLGTPVSPTAPRVMSVTRHSRLDAASRSQVALVGIVGAAASGLVLIVGCASVANLLLVRSVSRAREAAVRLAIGAQPGDLARQFLVDGVLTTACVTAIGALLAWWTVEAVPAFFTPEEAAMLDARLDTGAIGVALAVAAVSTVIVNIAPLRRLSRATAVAALRSDGGQVGTARETTARRVLVLGQIALACVLLVAADMLGGGLRAAMRTDAGFTAQNVVVALVEIPKGTKDDPAMLAYLKEGQAAALELPDVAAAAWSATLPLARAGLRTFVVPGSGDTAGTTAAHVDLAMNDVTANYFAVAGLTLLGGRTFDEGDVWDSTPVAVIDELVAQRLFPEGAIGRTLQEERGRTLTVVGIVRAGRFRSLQPPPEATVYYPLSQKYYPKATPPVAYTERRALLARVTANAEDNAVELGAALSRLDGGVPVLRTLTLDRHLAEVLTAERLTTALVSVCGWLSLVLAAIGVYGVMAQAVVRRTREIGLRVALGAAPVRIVRLVLGAGLRLTLTGIAIGLALAFGATRALATMVEGTAATGSASFATAVLMLAPMAIVASVVPALNALRVQPTVALRDE